MVKEKLLHKSSIAERAVSLILSISNEGIKHLKIDDIAEALNKNKKWLALIFKREQKISIPAFIRREKLHRAFYILDKDFSISIPDLSEKLGFISPSQFEKAFDEYHCILPGKYQAIKKEFKNRTKKNAQPKKHKKILEPLRN